MVGVSEPAEAFLDQLVTWRELGFNMAWQRSDYDQYDALPDWARHTLAEHAEDVRPHVYSLEELEAGKTHDPLWNAAQTQLVREGRLHNYLRMLWGKRILEWTPAPTTYPLRSSEGSEQQANGPQEGSSPSPAERQDAAN